MDRYGRSSLTRPATPQAFKVSGGRYSFTPPAAEESNSEVIDLPAHLREERPGVDASRR